MESNLSDRLLIRIAGRICDALRSREASFYTRLNREIEHMVSELSSLQDVQKKLEMCVSRSWQAASMQLKRRVERITENLPYYVTEVDHAARSCQQKPPSLGDVFLDLKQAQEEFGELKYDREEKALSIVTEPIELEDIYLGDFEIRLRIPGLAEGHRDSAYTVVALDPHPAGCCDSVTHPHVRDETLCAGDAAAAIESALAQGRIFDFFVMVRSVLTHYNPNSPHVSLESWDGVSCYACAEVVDHEETHYCSSCEQDFCENCVSYCRKCDETTCLGCLKECEVCGDRFCPSCMTSCEQCGRSICTLCSEEEQCPCHQEEEEEADDTGEDGDATDDSEQAPAEGVATTEAARSSEENGVEVLANGVGQAPLLP